MVCITDPMRMQLRIDKGNRFRLNPIPRLIRYANCLGSKQFVTDKCVAILARRLLMNDDKIKYQLCG